MGDPVNHFIQTVYEPFMRNVASFQDVVKKDPPTSLPDHYAIEVMIERMRKAFDGVVIPPLQLQLPPPGRDRLAFLHNVRSQPGVHNVVVEGDQCTVHYKRPP